MRAVAGAGRLVAGRYRLSGPIGRGAMGIVWRGRDELLDRDVAVKEVQITSLAGPADAEAIYQRTLREARTAARLSHPSVVTVFDVVEEDGSPWIVMELVPARSLDLLIAEDGPLPPLEAARLGENVLSALATAHEAGVLHRDVKPSNVLITGNGRAVLTDFGIATLEGDPGLTQAGMVFGTPGFTAPERVRGQPASPASDLWSLGATLYAAVEGRGPFDRPGGSVMIMDGIVNEDVPRAPSAGPLAPVIEALLRRDPAARPDAQTAARLLADAALPSRTGAGPLAGSRPDLPAGQARVVAARQASTGSRAVPGGAADAAAEGIPAAGQGVADAAAGGAVPAFMQTPVFADLKMPDVDTSADSRRPGGRPTSVELPAFMDAPAFADPPALPPDHAVPWSLASAPASWDPQDPLSLPDAHGRVAAPAGSPVARPAGRGRPLAAAAALVLAVAGVVGWSAYARSRTSNPPQAPSAQSPAGMTIPARSGGGPPPAGYKWYRVSAASLGATAGFKMAVPDAWQMSRRGLLTYFGAAAGRAYIEVDETPFAYAGPVAEAMYRQAQARADHSYQHYQLIAITPAEFRGIPAAIWRFRWQQPGDSRIGVLEVLFTRTTSAGSQSCALTVSAPAARFAAARAVFHQALQTFGPLP